MNSQNLVITSVSEFLTYKKEGRSEVEIKSLTSNARLLVESEGIEPSSKRRINKLSTCLFLD